MPSIDRTVTKFCEIVFGVLIMSIAVAALLVIGIELSESPFEDLDDLAGERDSW